MATALHPHAPDQPHEAERKASWLELFYDLVFVIAVSKVAAHLQTDASLHGFAVYGGLFAVVLWAWSGFVSYTSRYDLDDRFHRLVTLVQMLAVAALAVQLAEVPGRGEVGFVCAYVAVRLCLVLLYVRAHGHPGFAELRPMNRHLIGSYGLAAGVWLLSLALPAPWRYLVWALAMVIDMSAPVLGLRRFTSRKADTALMPERYGLVTLIVLGESILAVVTNLGDQHWAGGALAAAIMGFGLAAAVWWSYFNYVERAPLQCSLGNGQLYSYLHLPLIVGLTAAGVGVGRVIHEAEHAIVEPGTLLALAGGMGLFLLSFYLIQANTYPRAIVRTLRVGYVPVLVALAVVSVAGLSWPPLVALLAVLALVSLVAALDVRWRVAQPARAYTTPEEDPRDAPVVKRYTAADVEVSFEPGLCIHSGQCLSHLPAVFNVRDRPWVRPDRATAEEVVAAVHHCPTRALKIVRGPLLAPAQQAASGAEVVLVPRGPALVSDARGVRLEGEPEAHRTSVALCRCGRSATFPYCDGAHKRAPG